MEERTNFSSETESFVSQSQSQGQTPETSRVFPEDQTRRKGLETKWIIFLILAVLILGGTIAFIYYYGAQKAREANMMEGAGTATEEVDEVTQQLQQQSQSDNLDNINSGIELELQF